MIPGGPRGAGGDFWFFLHGARQIAAGHDLYGSAGVPAGFYGYVYTPLVALVLLPFAHAATVHVWHVWTALSIAALILSGGLITLVEAPTLRSWRRPLLFGFTALTALQFVTTQVKLSQGQTDAFVLVALALAVLASDHGLAATSGVSIGGGSGLVGLLHKTFDTRSQHLVSHSVWGTPLLLFSNSGFAHPVLVSTPLHILTTVTLVTWIWAARWLRASPFCLPESVIAGTLGVWWLVLFHVNWSPLANGSPTESALRISVISFANLAAVTVSVLGDRRCGSSTHRAPAPDRRAGGAPVGSGP